MLNFLLDTGSADIYINVCVVFRILLTIKSTERSFSKLKIIKTCVRFTLSQEKLNNLAILSIENDISSSLDYDALIETFSASKYRKVNY